MKNALEGASTVAGLAAVAGGLSTAISGGELEVALFVIGFLVSNGYALALLCFAGLVVIRLARWPFTKQLSWDLDGKQIFWLFYVGFLGALAALITWAAVDSADLESRARDMDYFHWVGIIAVVIGALGAGVLIQPGSRVRTVRCTECAGRVPATAKKCRHWKCLITYNYASSSPPCVAARAAR
jgi:hypothetical protein